MFDYQTVKLMHRHGDDDWAPMVEAEPHSPSGHDVERTWLRTRLFQCTKCEEIVAVPSQTDPADLGGR